MPGASPEPADFTRSARSFWRGLGVVGVLAIAAFAYDLSAERHFVDESAYLSQTYYAELFFQGAWNDPAWLDYPAYDLPPLPKYLIGAALRLGGHRLPGPAAAHLWYANTSSRFLSPGGLTIARFPAVVLGALGCVAVYVLGTLLRDVRVGGLAAGFLMFNPLYRLHARRAMSDVPAEAFILLALAASLWGWKHALRSTPKRRDAHLPENSRPIAGWSWSSALLAGLCAGLAALAKLNGALAMIVIVAWGLLAAALPGFSCGSKRNVLLAALLSGCASLATFVAFNPFLTAHPSRAPTPEVAALANLSLPRRAEFLVQHRVAVSRGQTKLFPHNALTTPVEKLQALAVQGFGRFGLFGPHFSDSTKRRDWPQDWGALVWLPCVLAGAIWAGKRGRDQLRVGEPPTAWAILVEASVALVVVWAYLPLAWDRYFLSIQPGSALLAAGAVAAGVEGLTRAVHPRRKGA